MAISLREYYGFRCVDTLDAMRNMSALFEDLRNHIRDGQLKEVLNHQFGILQEDMQAFSQITNIPAPTTTTRRRKTKAASESEGEPEGGERLVIVGRSWTGEVGRGIVEHYRVYVTRVPQHVIDTDAAMLSEEICHFNIGNYTGLIVLAKELGDNEAAMRLQSCIDRQTSLRMHLEGTLWQIVDNQHRMEERKAA